MWAENATFFWRGHGQKYRSEFTKTRHYKCKFHFYAEGPSPSLEPSPGRWEEVPLSTPTPHPHQAFSIRPCVPQNSGQIYTTAYEWVRLNAYYLKEKT